MHSEIMQATMNKVQCCHVSSLLFFFFLSPQMPRQSHFQSDLQVYVYVSPCSQLLRTRSSLKAIIKSRHSPFTSLEIEREDHCCFFHLTNNQISFLSVSCEADTSLSSRRDAHTEPHKKRRVPSITSNRGQDSVGVPGQCNHLLQ